MLCSQVHVKSLTGFTASKGTVGEYYEAGELGGPDIGGIEREQEV